MTTIKLRRKPKSAMVTVRITKEQHRHWLRCAKSRGYETLSDWVREVCRREALSDVGGPGLDR